MNIILLIETNINRLCSRSVTSQSVQDWETRFIFISCRDIISSSYLHHDVTQVSARPAGYPQDPTEKSLKYWITS